jgi:hemerythrin-like domain-containing protein
MTRICLLVLALTITFAAPALAEPRTNEEHTEAMRRVRIVRAAALTEALELDEATAARLFPYLRETDTKMEEIHARKREARHALRAMVGEEALVEKDVDRYISIILDAEVELAEARAEQLDGLRSVLTVEQRVMFMMVQRRIDQEVRRVMREERSRRRGGSEEGRRDRRERRLRR